MQIRVLCITAKQNPSDEGFCFESLELTLQSLRPQQELALQALQLGFPQALLLLDPYMLSLNYIVKTTEPL